MKGCPIRLFPSLVRPAAMLVLRVLLSGVAATIMIHNPVAGWANPAGSNLDREEGTIHIIPTLSTPSLKNGDVLTIQAVVSSMWPVTRVEAHIDKVGTVTPVTRLEMRPGSGASGGVNSSRTVGLWQADWTAVGLEEATYSVAITVQDDSGRVHTDRSLRFTDPIAGRDQVGSADYPDGGLRPLDSIGGFLAHVGAMSAVIDVTNRLVFFGTNTSPGQVVTVALGDQDASPVRLGSLTLADGEDDLRSAVIDAANGYAYFGTNTSPGRVIKVALGGRDNPPVRIGSLILADGEDDLRSAVIDAASGYAYFGSGTSPGRVVKVALGGQGELPGRVGATVLVDGEDDLRSAVIDAASGYAYFGTGTSPGRVVKVSLGGAGEVPVRVGAVALDDGEDDLGSAVIEAANGFAYFGTNTSPGQVVKVALGGEGESPSRVAAVMLGAYEGYLNTALIDLASGHAYFGTWHSQSASRVVKVALGEGDAPPTRVASVSVGTNRHFLRSAVMDPTTRTAYLGTESSPSAHGLAPEPAQMASVSLRGGAEPPMWSGSVGLLGGEANFSSALIDPVGGYAYFGTWAASGAVVKMALGDGSSPPRRVGSLPLNPGEGPLQCGVIDINQGYAYFGTWTVPGRVVKVALGEGDDPPRRVDAVILNEGEDWLSSAVIDTARGYVYFGTGDEIFPGRVVKLAVGEGDAYPVYRGAVILGEGETELTSAVIDPAAGYAYFGTLTQPGRVVKVALGSGPSPPQRAGAITLANGEDFLLSGVIDTGSGHAYFGTFTFPGRVVKINLGSGSSAPTRVGSVTLEQDENGLTSAVVDPKSGYAYFGTLTDPGRVVKVALGDGDSLPSRLGSIDLEPGVGRLETAVMDTRSGHAYFGSFGDPGFVSRVGLSQQGFVKGTSFTLPESGWVTNLRFFSHSPGGNVRLALYDGAAEPKLLWQSGVIPNTDADAWLSANVASGTPSSLELQPGAYWLAWQTDSAFPVASYASGVPGDGFYVPRSWGSFPTALGSASKAVPTLTDEIWSTYLTYETELPRTLTVIATGAGVGSVSSDPAGIECGASCTAAFADGTVVTLSALARPGSVFSGWSGGGCAGVGTCTVTMGADTVVEALFSEDGPQVGSQWLQVAAHGPGLRGSHWRSDVGLRNVGERVAAVEARFYPDDGGTVRSSTSYVPVGAQAVLEDVVGQLYYVGSGALELIADEPVIITSRTYNQVPEDADCMPGGTFGQYYGSYGGNDALGIGEIVWLGHLVENLRFRSNLAFTNTGSAAAQVLVELFGGAGEPVHTFNLNLAPGQFHQEVRVFRKRGGLTSLEQGSARVTVTEGAGVVVSASVVDNITNDPTTIPMARQPVDAEGSIWIQVAAHSPGLHVSFWRSDLGLLNVGEESATIDVLFHPGPGGEPLSLSALVESGAQTVLKDVVGQVRYVGSGALEVISSQPVVVTSRIYHQVPSDAACSPRGSFGQYYGGYAFEQGLGEGESAWLTHLAESERFRTNLAFTNMGPLEATVEVELFDSSGTLLAVFNRVLEPGRYRQETRVFEGRAGHSAVEWGAARVTVIQGEGVLASASVVDNITNDPTTIPMVRGPGSSMPETASRDADEMS